MGVLPGWCISKVVLKPRYFLAFLLLICDKKGWIQRGYLPHISSNIPARLLGISLTYLRQEGVDSEGLSTSYFVEYTSSPP